MPILRPDLAQTLAFAALVLFAGFYLKHKIALLDRLNIPAPVVGSTPDSRGGPWAPTTEMNNSRIAATKLSFFMAASLSKRSEI